MECCNIKPLPVGKCVDSPKINTRFSINGNSLFVNNVKIASLYERGEHYAIFRGIDKTPYENQKITVNFKEQSIYAEGI